MPRSAVLPGPAHLVAHQASQRPGALPADPPGHAAGPDLARLGDGNVAEGPALDVVIQDVLRQLRALATARGAVNDHHRVTFYQRNHLQVKTGLSPLPQNQ